MKLLAFIFLLQLCIPAATMAQDEPEYFSLFLREAALHPSAAPEAGSTEFILSGRSQSAAGLCDSRTFHALFRRNGQKGKCGFGLGLVADHWQFQESEQIALTVSPRLFRRKGSELRAGFQTTFLRYHFYTNNFLDRISDPANADADAINFHRSTFILRCGLTWQHRNTQVSLSYRLIPGMQNGFALEENKAFKFGTGFQSHLFTASVRNEISLAGSGKLVIGVNVRTMQRQFLHVFFDNNFITNRYDGTSYYNTISRNGETALVFLGNLLWTNGKWNGGIVFRGFGRSVLTGGLSAGYTWNSLSCWAIGCLPNRVTGFTVETGISLPLKRKESKPAPVYTPERL